MQDREFRGGSEPPPPSKDVNDKTGLRRVPIKIAGVAVGSVERLSVGGEDSEHTPWGETSWRRSVTPGREVASANGCTSISDGSNLKKLASKSSPSASKAMPFGSGAGANPFPAVCPKIQFPKRGKKSSSVSNIVAALESEISNWNRNHAAQRDYSGLLGWNTRPGGTPTYSNSEVELAGAPTTNTQAIKFEPRKEPKLERFFTFGDESAANNGSNLNQRASSSNESPDSGSSYPQRERGQNPSEVHGGEMGAITGKVGPEGRLQSQAQSREWRRGQLSFDGQVGEGGHDVGTGHGDGRGKSQTIATVTKSDSKNSNGPSLSDKSSPEVEHTSVNSVVALRREQESKSGHFMCVSRVSEREEEGVPIRAGTETEKEKKDDALTSQTQTAVSEYLAHADLECAIQGSSLGEDETAEQMTRAEEKQKIGQHVAQTFDSSTNGPVLAGLSQKFSEKMTSGSLLHTETESNRSKESMGGEEDIALNRSSSLLRRPIEFMTASCSYGGSTSRVFAEMAKNASRSPTRSPLPSPSPIRHYLSEDSGTRVNRGASAPSPSINSVIDIDGGGQNEVHSCNKVAQSSDVKNNMNEAFQGSTVGAVSAAVSDREVMRVEISGGNAESFYKSDEAEKESSLINRCVQEPGQKIISTLPDTTAAPSSTEEDVVEMGPENVKIHESVIPRIKITTKSSYYTAAASLENELTWAKDTKMKGDLFASLLKVSSGGPRSSNRNSASAGGEENRGEPSASADASNDSQVRGKSGELPMSAGKSGPDNLVISKAESAAFEDLFEQLCHEGDAGNGSPELEEINFGANTLASKEARRREKRQRNKTIDYHDLSPRAWNDTVAHVAPTECGSANGVPSSSADASDSEQQVGDGEEGLGQGLGIILDKLKNIETKLDEIKELEEQNICVATTGYAAEDVSKFPAMLPELGVTPTCSESSLQLLTHLTSDGDLGLRRQPKSDAGFLVDRGCNTSQIRDDSSIDSSNGDVTVMADNEERTDTECEEISISDTLIEKRGHFDGESKCIVVTSPIPSPSLTATTLDLKLEIASVKSVSEGEGDEFHTEEERQRRIERLAQQIMEEKKKLERFEEIEAQHKREHKRVGVEEAPGLETLSERSEDDTDTAKVAEVPLNLKHSRTRSRPRRTRSSSRDRSLVKIHYCWRCHQTGHEAFDCSAQLHPGSWCPRCLEKSHWEDDCWVDGRQMLCTICTLPGHLPCVHETSDFRQRKLVVETFGWLAFKDWFREPDFWSWWNVSGYTNVPLYKLMQHHRFKEI